MAGLWLVPWLEMLGLLAVVFAVGIGLGFGGSALVRRRTPMPHPGHAASRTAPAVASPAPDAADSALPPSGTAVPTTPEPAPPVEPTFQTVTHREMTYAAYRPVPPFSATLTRPAGSAGQPSS